MEIVEILSNSPALKIGGDKNAQIPSISYKSIVSISPLQNYL